MNAALLVSALLLAQTSTPPADPGPKAKAQVLLKDGAQHYQQGAFAEALEKFRQAYEVFPSPKLLFNIGQANRELGRDVEAVESFERFLFEATDASPELVSEAKRSVNELAPKIGKMLIDCSIDGVEITVDGRKIGKTPLADFIWVSGGSHQVTATHPSIIPVVQTVSVAPGTIEPLAIRPRSIPLASAVGRVPSSSRAPAAALQAARPTTSSAESKGWWLGRKWTWVAAGSTVVFVTAGAIAGSLMQSKYDDLRNTCGKAAGTHWTGCSSGDISSLDTRKDVANVFWGLSAAAVVTTGALFFVERHGVTVSPMAGEMNGLVASVRY